MLMKIIDMEIKTALNFVLLLIPLCYILLLTEYLKKRTSKAIQIIGMSTIGIWIVWGSVFLNSLLIETINKPLISIALPFVYIILLSVVALSIFIRRKNNIKRIH